MDGREVRVRSAVLGRANPANQALAGQCNCPVQWSCWRGTAVAPLVDAEVLALIGERVEDAQSGTAALKVGKKINYDGASGPMDHNDQHNVFGPFDLVQSDTGGKMVTLQTLSAADGVYATLREAIVSDRRQPGDRLGEEHLARSFGVSRAPVREAILRLETEHLALREERRGAAVRGIREQEVLEVYAVRAALDGLAAGLAMLRGR